MPTPATHKLLRQYADPVHPAKDHPKYERPPGRVNQNLKLPLSAVDTPTADIVDQSGTLVFHCVGDTGGIHGTSVQEQVADAMVSQFQLDPQTGHKSADPSNPAFFYHLGDVIYFNGVSTEYVPQFYEPYKFYPSVIFAIPGNHDGDTHTHKGDPVDSEPSLYGFMRNFCDSQPHREFAYRDTMTLPYVYWTLTTSQATIIGLYGNIDGMLDAFGTVEQQAWLEQELRDANPNACLLLAVHQPPYSVDTDHGGYSYIGDSIDRACENAGRWPDMVLSGHVHNYQRFVRQVAEREIPYVVAGNGGYANTEKSIHKLARQNPGTPVPVPLDMPAYNLQLRSYNEHDAGFLRITVANQQITCEYHAVPLTGGPAVRLFDSFTVACGGGQVVDNVDPLPSSPSQFRSIIPRQ